MLMKKLLLPSKILAARKNETSETWKHEVIKTKRKTGKVGRDKNKTTQNIPNSSWEISYFEHLFTWNTCTQSQI